MTEATTQVDSEVSTDEQLQDLFDKAIDSQSDSSFDSVDIEQPTSGQPDEETDAEAEQAQGQDEPVQEAQESVVEASEEPQSEGEEPASTDATDEDPQNADIWANASEAHRAEYQRLQHEFHVLTKDHRANAGRVQGYSKKVDKLQKELDELRQASAKAQTEAGTQEGELNLDGKTIQEIEQDYPEVAQYIRYQIQNTVKSINPKLETVERKTDEALQSVSAQAETAQQLAVRQELTRLQQSHPDYLNVRQSQDFQQWLQVYSGDMSPWDKQQLVNSYSADDNIALLSEYKQQRAQAQAVSSPPVESKKQTASKLSAHAELPKQGSAPPNALPEDPAELFDLLVKQNKL